MNPSIWLLKDQSPQTPEEVAKMCKVLYCKAISSLNYCTITTHPDIAFLVSLPAQFMKNLENLIGKL